MIDINICVKLLKISEWHDRVYLTQDSQDQNKSLIGIF